MAANLTPQYLEAEAECKKAHTAEERLACLKKMYALLPKHKASEKLQAELRFQERKVDARLRSEERKRWRTLSKAQRAHHRGGGGRG